MRLALRVAASLALIPVALGAGIGLGLLLAMPSGNGWIALGTVVPFAFGLGVVAPHRWAAPIAMTLILGGILFAQYGDGDDSCDGRPSCEDNLGFRLTLTVPMGFAILPATLGAILRPPLTRAWARRRGAPVGPPVVPPPPGPA